jgi:hypothetical protein
MALAIAQGVGASIIIGLLLGTLIGTRFRFPKEWTGFMVTVALNIMAPFIGQGVILVGITQWNITIVFNYLLLGLITPINIAFVWRFVQNRKSGGPSS